MSTAFSIQRDLNGIPSYGIPFGQKEFKFETTLLAGVAQSFTVPVGSQNGKYIAMFSFTTGADCFVALNTTATLPTGSFATTETELRPSTRTVKAGDTLSFITPATTCYVWVRLDALSL
jgi:hypothetical protein